MNQIVRHSDQKINIAIGDGAVERPVLLLDEHFHFARSDRTLELFETKAGLGLRVSVENRLSDGDRRSSLLDTWHCLLPAPWEYHWLPHLRPETDHRAAAHSFRSPAVIVVSDGFFMALLPDLSDPRSMAWMSSAVLDVNPNARPNPTLSYGLEPTRPVGHVLFELDPDTYLRPEAGIIHYSYEIIGGKADGQGQALRLTLDYLWQRFGHASFQSLRGRVIRADRLAEVSYATLFDRGQFVRFNIKGKRCGAFRAESHHAEYFQRPDPVVWNQCWFNAQRSAYGLAHFGRKTGRRDWIDAAGQITQLTLSAPDWGGLWPAIYAYEDGHWWGSIPRLNGGRHRLHVADSASTAEWLLRYHLDFSPDEYARRKCSELGSAMIRLQDEDGSIAPWHDWDGTKMTAAPELSHSAETAAAASFLALLARTTGSDSFADAAMRAADFLAGHVIGPQRYQDFETFFSCSPKPLDFVDERSGCRPQSTLAIYWSALAMLRVYELTGRQRYLDLALQATDSLSLYQQIWSPPFLSLAAFGGFGVMNSDAEWSDARQSLFAPLYFDIHRVTGFPEYYERGVSAAQASFTLACVPEHDEMNPKGFDRHPPGIMPENYAHSGRDLPSGRSDTCWGECGALTTAALLERQYDLQL